MKTLFCAASILAISILFVSCSNDEITGNGGNVNTSDFDLYVLKFNINTLKLSTYLCKLGNTNLTLLNDSMAAVSRAKNNKTLFVKLDTSGYFYSDIYSADYNGRNLVKLRSEGYYPIYTNLSNDATKALFTTDAGNYLVLTYTDGSAFQVISDGIRGTETAPVFSPDSRKIAFFEAPSSLQTGLYTVNTDGTGKKLLKDSIFYRSNYTIDWSQDGKTIAFEYNKNNLTICNIYTIDTSGNNLISLSEGETPEFNNNGNKICFKRNVNQGIYDIFIMNSDGTNELNISNKPNQHKSEGKWSPDGTKVLYCEFSGAYESDLYIYDLATSQTTLFLSGINTAYWK